MFVFIVLNVVVKDVKLRRLPQRHRANIQNPVGGWRVTKILSFTCSIKCCYNLNLVLTRDSQRFGKGECNQVTYNKSI